MSNQDQIGNTSMNPLSVPTSPMLADVRTFSAGGGDEHPLKVRKPYTITKQRERWAEEEHKKFLEALQLYGRAWRQIEEHIGTKTAVQIRSHAQKFFSKVARESGTDGNVKSVEIPPPRPKRKPAHPYPRKFVNTCGNGGLSIGKLERSLSPMKSGFEQENRSPTSVLSGVGSDTLGSLLSSIPSGCASPVTSAAGSNEQDASVEEENNPQLPIMELDIRSSSRKEEQVQYLKLFGKTVLVTDSNKPSSPSSVGNTIQAPNPLLTPGFSGSQERSSNWSPCTMFYPLPASNFGDITRIIPLPWWGMYGNLSSYSFDHQQDESLRQEPLNEKECSWTDSNTNNASANEGGNVVSSQSAAKRRRNMETDDSPLLRRPGPRSRSDASVRGFVPYKRDDGEGQSIGLCL